MTGATSKRDEVQLRIIQRDEGAKERKQIVLFYASLAAALNSTASAVNFEERRSDVFELFLLAQLEIQILLDRQRTLRGIIESAKYGRLHPGLLHNQDLLALLKQLPNRDPLNVETLSLDHQLMKVRMVQSGRELLFRLDVPLLEKRLFQLFRAYAVPAALDGGFHYYHLEADYLPISSAAQHFALMREKGC